MKSTPVEVNISPGPRAHSSDLDLLFYEIWKTVVNKKTKDNLLVNFSQQLEQSTNHVDVELEKLKNDIEDNKLPQIENEKLDLLSDGHRGLTESIRELHAEFKNLQVNNDALSFVLFLNVRLTFDARKLMPKKINKRGQYFKGPTICQFVWAPAWSNVAFSHHR